MSSASSLLSLYTMWSSNYVYSISLLFWAVLLIDLESVKWRLAHILADLFPILIPSHELLSRSWGLPSSFYSERNLLRNRELTLQQKKP